MSDALDYLLKTRPEAMKPYFKFLKEAGKRLDPKTRSLISVITKVHAQTENGLRLTCPKHQWVFDIATGQCVAKGDRPLRRFDHKVENGRLMAYW